MRVFKNRWFNQFARKESLTDDLLWEIVERAEKGLIDAKLGAGVIKQRVARINEGKSSGYRVIMIFRQFNNSFFIYGYSKSSLSNISKGEIDEFRKLAKILLDLTENNLNCLIRNKKFIEVFKSGKKIS